jgi:hypothetical protein
MTQAQAETCAKLAPFGRNASKRVLPNGLVMLTIRPSADIYINEDGTIHSVQYYG